ncbi:MULTISPECIES: hypothetical protein [unclassified Sporosarcina]|uniref:hypothetical protein n=1 Tax=unclassified Sporosarcina TaxID=2647733 RepID=UPI000C163FFB|nr:MULTISPECIES: hypothetical protein [unclassified Sporosarcina]PIC87915.1 hypothetical protein CSV72_01845 [Sporosarcina sp. P20a]PID00440.1 hypothetical protein CSV68_02625 [Sporosarcina sp. P29]PID05729.1 hypothetical protein CSV66_08085 [Sporosarcina sp. P30]PID08923.1 hypothetical protein CSV65_08085 [Sporosarcina sp. P31]PID12009.1 hypothetical protein CSV64_08630 [Sporosarcina sp. P32b]
MDLLQLIQEIKQLPDQEAVHYAASYGVELSTKEVQQLRPLLDEVSFTWLFTGIPSVFIEKITSIIGYEKTMLYLEQYKLQ